MADLGSIFKGRETVTKGELAEILASSREITIQKIISPESDKPGQVYDQEEHEFVMVVRGYAELEFFKPDEDNARVIMEEGDYINIPPHLKHRVIKTKRDTTWLAVFYKK